MLANISILYTENNIVFLSPADIFTRHAVFRMIMILVFAFHQFQLFSQETNAHSLPCGAYKLAKMTWYHVILYL